MIQYFSLCLIKCIIQKRILLAVLMHSFRENLKNPRNYMHSLHIQIQGRWHIQDAAFCDNNWCFPIIIYYHKEPHPKWSKICGSFSHANKALNLNLYKRVHDWSSYFCIQPEYSIFLLRLLLIIVYHNSQVR